MATKKKTNLHNLLSLFLVMLTVVIIGPLPIGAAIRLTGFFHVPLYAGLQIFFGAFGILLGIQIGAKLFGVVKPRPFFTNFRDGVVKSISYILFLVIALLPADLNESPFCFSFILSFPLAVLIAVSFSYLLGTDELKQKIRKFPKVFKKKRIRKRETGASNDRPIDS